MEGQTDGCGVENCLLGCLPKSYTSGLALSRPTTYFCDSKGTGRMGLQAAHGDHWPQDVAVFQRYNNPSEEDIKAVVLADPPRKAIR